MDEWEVGVAGPLFGATKPMAGPFLGTLSQRLCIGRILRDPSSSFPGRGMSPLLLSAGQAFSWLRCSYL